MDLEKLSNEELEKLCADGQRIISARKNQRKKELWGNVVSAIKKYEKETDGIIIDSDGYRGEINFDFLDDIGVLYIRFF